VNQRGKRHAHWQFGTQSGRRIAMSWEYVVVGIAGVVSLWLSIKLLGFLFRFAWRVFGWLGSLALASLPAVFNYYVLGELGITQLKASLASVVVAVLVSAVTGKSVSAE
jgi:hypothetical protein